MNPLALTYADPENSTSPHLPAIVREVQERLGRSSYRALRDVSCIASDGVLHLHGCLPSHYLKQVAQEVASGAVGVRHLVNRIVVSRPASSKLQPRDLCQSVDLS